MTHIQTAVRGNTVTLTFPQDIPQKCRDYHIDLPKDLKQYIAVLLYKNSAVSIGKAAELADMDPVAFQFFLSSAHIPISNLSFQDVMADVKKIEQVKAHL
ncbi:MAG: UPF0175 family protein [Spirochaetaceae bacterium]|jgi:predicted HTH domain antitoxin|nr:UPF0175 family protein [Spirochaetaceae bacterium]